MKQNTYKVKDIESVEAMQLTDIDSVKEIEKWVKSINPDICVKVYERCIGLEFVNGALYLRIGDYVFLKGNKFNVWRKRSFESKYKINR